MVTIENGKLTIEEFIRTARGYEEVSLSKETKDRITASRKMLEKAAEGSQAVYGVNTGFGKFSEVKIGHDELKDLQRNLIISHACGVGSPMKTEEVRGLMLLRINALSRGYSGIRLETVETLTDMLNKKVHPVIPVKGSLGASGDLAPLAHMVLTLIGEGNAEFEGVVMPSKEAMNKACIKPVELEAKEGLALINGTQALTSIGTLAYYDAVRALRTANLSAALTMEALRGITTAFDERLHIVRGHKGQIAVAREILDNLEGSTLVTRQNDLRVQDAYSIRCIPQVHGAIKDTLDYALDKINIEINAVTDNPIVLNQDEIYSGGNFHGEPMALIFDFLAIAVSELANISERRLERLVNYQLNDLPAFLAPSGGLNSGFMITQYSAAALVSENKILSHPASVDSIPSSANQEDHVSMGNTAARKLREIVENTRRVISIEAFAACQAIDFREDFKLGKETGKIYSAIRDKVRFIEKDVIMYEEMNKVYDILDTCIC
ncbi:histidine ammonia-lyase [Proteiniclasticum sp.]|uniref:histidine ammonia-lyase n=1 Tax=Proteiniclasticum sp. TaxID=2053595 RepID=UPI002896D44E|nr:histidine ammonia-lyase [Proteiniclasticum sp.]